MRTLFGEALRRHACDTVAPPALSGGSEDVSYEALVARVERCAAWLAGEGCARGVPVAVCVGDDNASLVVSLALLDLGVPQVGLSVHQPEAMRVELARRIGVGRVVADDPRHALPGIATSVMAPAALDVRAARACEALDPDPDAIAMYSTSSGTTGRAKVLAITHRQFAWRARQAASTGAFAHDERVLVPMSCQEYPGKSVRLYTLFHGATAIDWPLAAPTVAHANRTRATTIQLTVLQARGLAAAEDAHERLAPSTRVLLGASQMPSGLPARFASRVGGRVYNRYGTMEVGIVATMVPEGDDGTPDAVGRPVVDVEIVDGEGRARPPGEPGEIRIRSEGMVDRYVDDASATARHFDAGWFYPRDVGEITAAGILRFLGRRDDMMSLNGINIFPAEIERVLEAHPSVKAAAAFAIRSPVHGDIPAAAVELHAPGDVDASALVRYAREQLGTRAPRKLVVVDALPRNDNGKVLKRELAASLAARA